MTALLVSDEEREYTVGLLRGHSLSGRLTAEEFEQRMDEALRARSAGDLWQALRSLPVEAPVVRRPAGNGPAVASLVTGVPANLLLMMSLGLLFLLTLPLGVARLGPRPRGASLGQPTAPRDGHHGEVLGIVGTALSLLLLAGCAALLTAL